MFAAENWPNKKQQRRDVDEELQTSNFYLLFNIKSGYDVNRLSLPKVALAVALNHICCYCSDHRCGRICRDFSASQLRKIIC